mgnify:CR=1 FL=1
MAVSPFSLSWAWLMMFSAFLKASMLMIITSMSSNQVSGGFNQPYVRLLSVSNEKGFRAKVEMDVKGKTGAVARKTVTLKPCQ